MAEIVKRRGARRSGGDLPEAPPAELPEGASLFLDFDGTLVELADRPDLVAVDLPLGQLLARIARRFDGRLALVSGRAAADLSARLGEVAFPISGSHGAEIRFPPDRLIAPDPPPMLAIARQELAAFAGGRAGVVVEEKPHGAALHYRMAAEHEQPCLDFARQLAEKLDMALQPGKMMVEVRGHGSDKGRAVHSLMREAPFVGSVPFFLGDDTTDEPAFAAVSELGGAGVLVGPPRGTAALYRLPGVAAVRAWLEGAAA